MTTNELYECLTASVLARIYVELGINPEAQNVRAAGIANCGEIDFVLLVVEYRESLNA